MASTQELSKVIKFCSTSSKRAPSPAVRRGEVYCLSSFFGRALQWYKEETGRQILLHYRKASSVGTRSQPPRIAKVAFQACDYTLAVYEVDALLGARADEKRKGKITETSESPLPTPPDDKAKEDLHWDPDSSVEHFQIRLSEAVHTKTRELRSRYDPEGIKHLCTVADMGWDCVDEEYCGHGLVDRCLRWVPKRLEHLELAMKVKMENFFSVKTANNHPERLKELRKYRYSGLKRATLEKLEALEVEVESCPEAMVEATMLESPTLGRWPGTPGFLKEDIKAQSVDFAGLTFAVDICLGEPRVMMV